MSLIRRLFPVILKDLSSISILNTGYVLLYLGAHVFTFAKHILGFASFSSFHFMVVLYFWKNLTLYLDGCGHRGWGILVIFAARKENSLEYF